MAHVADTRPTQDVQFASDGSAEARRLQRAAKRGEVARVASGVYVTGGSDAEIASRCRRNWQKLAAHLVPDAVVSHISAMEQGITPGGYVTISSPKRFNTTIKLPGIEFVCLRGPGPLHGDIRLTPNNLYWASNERRLLENLGRVTTARPTRAGRAVVEQRLAHLLNASGSVELNRIRDAARRLAPELMAESQFVLLAELIGGLLNTRPGRVLKTKAGRLALYGMGADAERIGRFSILADALRSAVLPRIQDVATEGDAKNNFAFLEAYFSNYLDGTRFTIEEAESIVLKNKIIVNRPKDSHDVLGVFNAVTQSGTRDTLPAPGQPFIEGLKDRHRKMLQHRAEIDPGVLKQNVNQVGGRPFVLPQFVSGTLVEGSEMALSVPEGMARSIFYGFLVSEVHPFNDGNGRLSRLIANAELSRVGQSRVIIPTLFHPQYVDCQRALSASDRPEPLIKALIFAAEWCVQFDYSDLGETVSSYRAANAFEENPIEFRLLSRGKRRSIPSDEAEHADAVRTVAGIVNTSRATKKGRSR